MMRRKSRSGRSLTPDEKRALGRRGLTVWLPEAAILALNEMADMLGMPKRDVVTRLIEDGYRLAKARGLRGRVP